MFEKPDPRRWSILALLFAVNLLDRQELAVLAPVIRDELHLSNTEYSWVVASFLLGLSLAQVPSGMLLDRIGVRVDLPLLMVWWSAANAAHTFARAVAHLCGFRFLLGVGECGNDSAGVKVISQWFPASERALTGGIFNSGTVLGAFAAPYLIVRLSFAYNWRIALSLSACGAALDHPLDGVLSRARTAAKGRAAATAAVKAAAALRQVWGVVLMRAVAGPVVHFYWYRLPEFI